MPHAADYRIESNLPLDSRWLPIPGAERQPRQLLVKDRALAVAMAAKSATHPGGQEIRVVHVPTGEVVFRKSTEGRAAADE